MTTPRPDSYDMFPAHESFHRKVLLCTSSLSFLRSASLVKLGPSSSCVRSKTGHLSYAMKQKSHFVEPEGKKRVPGKGLWLEDDHLFQTRG